MLDTIRVGDLSVLCARPHAPSHAPVLFIHGYFVDASVWSPWLERFAAHGTPACAVHLRGRAGSGLSARLGQASIEDFADDASVVAKAIGATTLVGHSMGGLVAQKVAERGDARGVVLITPAPPRGISVLSPRLAVRQVRYLPSILFSRPMLPTPDDLRDVVLNRVPAEQQAALLERMIPDSGRAGREMSITGIPVDPARVSCPMLVVAAGDDRFIPSRIAERVARRYGATLMVVPGRGHMVILEPGWEMLADRIEAWIREQA